MNREARLTQASLQEPCPGVLRFLVKLVTRCWQGLRGVSQRPARRLQLCESLALGDRRFVAVVAFERSRFLVGGTSTSLVLLAKLEGEGTDAAGPQHGRNSLGEKKS